MRAHENALANRRSHSVLMDQARLASGDSEHNIMARFITRVELHGAGGIDYENLHRFMAAEKFHRTITADDGQIYNLPTATYFSFGQLLAEDVRTLATRAAARTGRTADILVTDAGTIAWTLKPATPLNAPPARNPLVSPLPASVLALLGATAR
jgi:hypothetical protein